MTPKLRERHLNDLYTDMFTEDVAISEFSYLTSKQRVNRTTIAHIRKCYFCRELGSLVRRLDPKRFYTDL